MKGFIVSALCIAALSVLAKDKPPLNLPYTADGHIQYRDVLEVPGVPAAELMKRARTWLAHAYRSAPDVIKGSEEDLLVAKGVFDLGQGEHYRGTWRMRHTLEIEARDGRVRVTLDGFEVERANGSVKATPLDSDGYQKAPNEPRFGFRFLFEGLDREVRATLGALKVALSRPAESW